MKICSKCHVEKPLSEFYAVTSLSGLSSRCISCQLKAQAERKTRRQKDRSETLRTLVAPVRTQERVVYFITDETFVKIGVSRSGPALTERFKELQIGNPKPLRLIGVVPGDFHVERKLHGMLVKHHVRGEWFELNRPVRAILGELFPELKSAKALTSREAWKLRQTA